MVSRKRILGLALFILAAGLAFSAAYLAANWVESRSKSAVERVMTLQGYEWVNVSVDGLQLRLEGTAENEANRFRALTLAGSAVDPDRVQDAMKVQDQNLSAPPRFSVEILRNNDGVSVIGLIPASTDRQTILTAISEMAGGTKVTDLLETADYAAPENWNVSLAFGLEALEQLNRSKISISANRIAVTAITDSKEEKENFETNLRKNAPSKVALVLNINAPRPVITPFTTRFSIDHAGFTFDTCAADTAKARNEILSAALSAGADSTQSCTIGLGVPSPTWSAAVKIGIEKLAELGGGTITYSDADVSLVALDTTPEADFDRVVGELKAALPEVFSLDAVLPKVVVLDGTGSDPALIEFFATKSPEGQVQLRGRLADERQQSTVTSFAQARFGADAVYSATRLDTDLPDGWALRVLAGVEAMSMLTHGVLIVQPEFVELKGESHVETVNDDVARLLGEKLGEGQNYRLNITYVEPPLPEDAPKSPEVCITNISTALASRKIAFAPGAADIEATSLSTIDKLAEAFQGCSEVAMEIGGHTDSQGRETMNLNLSQQRADAVLNGLLARGVLTSNLTAKGYGETVPIADNGTEEGREENRRIEFVLVKETSEGEAETTATETSEPETTETENE